MLCVKVFFVLKSISAHIWHWYHKVGIKMLCIKVSFILKGNLYVVVEGLVVLFVLQYTWIFQAVEWIWGSEVEKTGFNQAMYLKKIGNTDMLHFPWFCGSGLGI